MLKEKMKQILGRSIWCMVEKETLNWSEVQEIRLRVGQPIMIYCKNREWVLPVKEESKKRLEKKDLQETLEYISHYSLYAYEEELRQGFITIEGGHRVGMAGQVVLEHGKIKNMKYISAINIRVSHQILNCADRIFPYITNGKEVCHTLIISPPGSGKTTLLRDVIRQISDGNRWIKGCSVGVVDERSELGGCYLGVAQNDLGMRTDILDCCPKAEGMLMLIRSMAPKVIAVDEIGSAEDIRALEYAMHCGCKILATVHGRTMEEIRKKPLFEQLVKERRFERYVVLGRQHKIEGIFDERGSILFREVL